MKCISASYLPPDTSLLLPLTQSANIFIAIQEDSNLSGLKGFYQFYSPANHRSTPNTSINLAFGPPAPMPDPKYRANDQLANPQAWCHAREPSCCSPSWARDWIDDRVEGEAKWWRHELVTRNKSRRPPNESYWDRRFGRYLNNERRPKLVRFEV